MFENVIGGVYHFNVSYTNDPGFRFWFIEISTVEEEFGSGVKKEKMFRQGRLIKKWNEKLNLLTK